MLKAELERILIRLTNKLIDKLDDPNIKVNLNGRPETPKDDDIDNFVNIDKVKLHGNKSDYIFGRLKRDAELGDSKAIEVTQKVREGKFTLSLNIG